ncbi:dynamin family protein [Acidimangrovimonas pyrenivorans]|uniref:Dynamin family protein n=1 Tax=Acidimangrovimonas pyrenivorans TaxID=2030798 RepID=A0ABV7AFX2_9RHOB
MGNPPPAEAATEDGAGSQTRKPRIAFMGEFSAGKSTLSNMLIGASPLPTKITATQLPPVWISYGDEAAYCEDLDGTRRPVSLDDLGAIRPEETRVIRIFQKSDILELCDLIDMPGISDPNMSPEVWQPVVGHADMVVWCTHATQAWRQSEAAVWESMAPKLRAHSLLLLTRFDKLLTDKDRTRVLRRVARETEGLFADCFPISLTEALEARDDRERWERSGAEAFMEALVERLHSVSQTLGIEVTAGMERSLNQHEPHDFGDGTGAAGGGEVETAVAAVMPQSTVRIVPRRVRVAISNHRRPARPDPDQAAEAATLAQAASAAYYGDDDGPMQP